MIHAVKGFGTVNKAEIDIVVELSSCFHDPADVGNLISGSSAFSKTSLNIREFTVHVVIDIPSNNVDSSCDSLSLAFCMKYSVYNLNKQGDNI